MIGGPKAKAINGEMKKILLTLSLGIVIIFIALALIMPWMGRMTPRTKRRWRCYKLQVWREKVELFVQENKRLPSSLFEMCRDDLEQGIWTFPPPFVSESQKPFGELTPGLATDPNRFTEIVEYDLFSGRHGWLIKELKPGKIYKKMLMIDQNGKIYEIRAIEQKTDEQK